MKKFKKAIALSLSLAMGLSLAACGEKESTTTEKATEAAGSEAATEATEPTEAVTESAAVEATTMEMTTGNGEKVHVYAWNNEIPGLIETFLWADYPELKDLVIPHNLNVGGTSADYINGLTNAFETEEAPSLIGADIDAAKNLMEQDFIVPLSEIGFDSACYANAYDYTVEYATNDAGELMGVTWQVTPGVVCYRTDIAEDVLGFSDPESVGAAISDWDKFTDVAQQMKDKGYKMISGVDDLKYPMLDGRSSAWVTDGVMSIDSSIDNYLETAKVFKENGYTHETGMWSADWSANMYGDVFCYFGTTWFVPFSLNIADTEADGKYNVTTGPVNYHWGGSFLMAAKDCANPELAAFVAYYMACDEDHLYDQAVSPDHMNFPNNKVVGAKLIEANEGSMDKLGGQNPYPLYDSLLGTLDLSLSTKYDVTINGYLDAAVIGYANGDFATVDEAKDSIRTAVLDGLPELEIK